MKKGEWIKLSYIIGIPILFALIVRFIFGVESFSSLFDVMTITFLFFLPFAIGALTIHLSSIESVYKRSYQFFMPWVPIMGFFLLTLLFNIEGWACWIMILPLFLIASSIGGMIAGHYKIKKDKNKDLYISLLLLVPFFLTPIEKVIHTIPGEYQAYTFIDINSSKEKIWNNVTRVREIKDYQNKAWFTKNLGFPRPIKAELNYEGVGANRKAIFDKGLIFDETVISYSHQDSMTFSIKANPYDIPSTTMDKHIVVGGEYFDVLNGTYKLERISNKTLRLHLYSHFVLNTTFNFYASWWAGWIMKDIQNNILETIKTRSEENIRPSI